MSEIVQGEHDIFGLDVIAYGTFGRGDLTIYVLKLRNNRSEIKIEFDRFRPIACVSCIIANKSAVDAGAKAVFDFETMTLTQTIPEESRPDVNLTFIGTLAGAV